MATPLRSFSELRTLKDALTRLPAASARVARAAAAEFSDRARAAIARRESVNGESFPAGVTLNKTGALAAVATRYEPIGNRVRASVGSLRYAKFQLRYGFLPRALPSAWADWLRDEARAELAATMRGER